MPDPAEVLMSDESTQRDIPSDFALLLNDRRCRVRHAQKLSTYAQRGAGDLDQVWWMGSVRNISGSGIGLVLKSRFEPGTKLTIELENAARTVSQTHQVEVVRVRPDQRGWLLGCSFVIELTDSQLQDMLQ